MGCSSKRGAHFTHIDVLQVGFEQRSSKCLEITAAGMEYGNAIARIVFSIGFDVRRSFPVAEPDIDVLCFNVDVDDHGVASFLRKVCP